MAVTVLMATVVLALFTMANTSTRSLRTYRQERTLRYGADAALEVGIAYAQSHTDAGTTGGTDLCGLDVDVAQSATDPILQPGSFLTVTCAATEGAPTSGGMAAGGGQDTRYVTFTVTCLANDASTSVPLGCSGSGTAREVATARVRFDIDYAAETADLDKRARIPKVISWSINRK